MESSSAPLTVVTSLLAAMGAGDPAGVARALADDATWSVQGDLLPRRTFVGQDAILGEFLAGAMSAFEPGSVRFEPTKTIASGSDVVVEWTLRARSASGRPYKNNYCGVFEVAEGYVTAVREYFDTKYATDVLLAGTQEAAAPGAP